MKLLDLPEVGDAIRRVEEDWEIGKLEDWKIGRLEDWKIVSKWGSVTSFSESRMREWRREARIEEWEGGSDHRCNRIAPLK
jgi:hypothetical protein